MNTTTVNIAFHKTLLSEIDRAAKAESRTRSDFLREAARAYIQRKQRWSDLFILGREVARTKGLSPGDVASEIKAYRKSKAAR